MFASVLGALIVFGGAVFGQLPKWQAQSQAKASDALYAENVTVNSPAYQVGANHASDDQHIKVLPLLVYFGGDWDARGNGSVSEAFVFSRAGPSRKNEAMTGVHSTKHHAPVDIRALVDHFVLGNKNRDAFRDNDAGGDFGNNGWRRAVIHHAKRPLQRTSHLPRCRVAPNGLYEDPSAVCGLGNAGLHDGRVGSRKGSVGAGPCDGEGVFRLVGGSLVEPVLQVTQNRQGQRENHDSPVGKRTWAYSFFLGLLAAALGVLGLRRAPDLTMWQELGYGALFACGGTLVIWALVSAEQ